ncbi:MAG: phosphoadenosine phosphosulfate reductase [Spirochaetes bacterium GWB1_59_5]|nr:MAG: phosphoadenosine phosphosulfate reductase [Spirochaetes bacterium GWB1_59_5]
MKTVAWFSAGVSSAVATKLMVEFLDEILYTHIEDQHPDTLRFVHDCEAWFGKPVKILQSPYKSVEGAIMATAAYPSGVYVNGPRGASCTRYLKRQVRQAWEYEQTEPLRYVWGMDCEEADRAARLVHNMPEYTHFFPLIDRRWTKEIAHEVLAASGIKRPAMYELGYHNNNCVGCVKGGMGYWNKIRADFPEVFDARAKLERVAGATCINGVYLDELEPERGRHEPPIVGDCGILCEVMGI